MEEKFKNIPESWEVTKITEVAFIEDHLRKPINSSERANRIKDKKISDLYPYYGATGQIGFIDEYITDGEYILVGEDGAPFLDTLKNKAYKITGKSWVNNHAHILKTNKFYSCDFLLHYLNQFDYSQYVSGTTRLKLTKSSLQNFPVLVPPLNEQKRIVEKIDELFSDLDNGVANLKKAQNQLKVYRQALLKNAFEGKLTEQWRKQNNPEPAEKLLERIKEERQKRYEQEIKDWKEAVKKWEKNGKKGKKPRRPKEYDELPPLTIEELKKLPRLPKEWKWIRNNELLYYVTSGSRDWKKYYSNKGAYFIRTQDIKYNSLNIENIAFVDLPKDVEGKRSLVDQGDILMTITGANVGKVAFIKKDLPETYVSQSVALMKLTYNKIAPYLHYYFQSNFFGKKFIDKLVYGVGRPVLSLENMKEVFVALCSLEEQKEIVSILDSNFSVIDKLEEEIEKALKKAETLRQSILKKAFEGKLVPQNPNDEPASELLERIKKEKEEYLAEQKEKKKKPVKRKQMDKNLSIEEVLKKSKEPLPAKDIWQQSKHKDDIEAFYAELKKVQHKIKEIKKGTESLLELKR